MSSGVYAIRCKASGKVYVGSSSDISKRWYNHRRNRANGLASRPKMGIARTAETRAKLRAVNLGKTIGPEVRAKIAATQKGRHFSPEHRARISAALRGRHYTPEHLAQFTVSRRARAERERIQKAVA